MKKVITFDDIRETPKYYIDILKEQSDGDYLFYNYAPYLVSHHLGLFPTQTSIKNSKLQYLLAIGKIRNIGYSKEKSIHTIKEDIQKVLSDNVNSEYYSHIQKYANAIVDEIHSYQQQNHILESAMLNYAPIVQYGGTLVKSEISDLSKYVEVRKDGTKRQDILESFCRMMISYTPSILEFSSEVVDPNDIAKKIISIRNATGDERVAKMYFLYVYLYYMEDPSKYDYQLQQILKFDNIYNDLHNGNKCDFGSLTCTIESLITVE